MTSKPPDNPSLQALREAVRGFNHTPIADEIARKFIHDLHRVLSARSPKKSQRGERIEEEKKYIEQFYLGHLSPRDLRTISAAAEAAVPIPVSFAPGEPEKESYRDLLDVLCFVLYEKGQTLRERVLKAGDTAEEGEKNLSRRLLEHYVRWRKMRYHLHALEANEQLPLEHSELALRDLKKLPDYIEKTIRLLEECIPFQDKADQKDIQAIISGMSYMGDAFKEVRGALLKVKQTPERGL